MSESNAKLASRWLFTKAREICPGCKEVMFTSRMFPKDIEQDITAWDGFVKPDGRRLVCFACDRCGYVISFLEES